MDLVLIWTALIGIVIIVYVVLDGFSLGIGILFPLAPDEKARDTMMNSIAPVWDANQTWLVFCGGALFAAFPTTYAVLFSALYIPLMTLIVGLIFRGVAFEFRINADKKETWNYAFFAGSLIAVLSQGLILGGYLSGITTTDSMFSGRTFDWLNPFAIMVALSLVAGYVLLGGTYLIMKTEGAVQKISFEKTRYAAWAVAGFIALVTLWAPLHNYSLFERLFSSPRIYFTWIFPILAVLAFWLLFSGLKKRAEYLPFFSSIGIFLSAYTGLLASIFPYAVLPDITVYQAAAQKESMAFILLGVILILPVILGYTGYSYWVFKGKVADTDGYH